MTLRLLISLAAIFCTSLVRADTVGVYLADLSWPEAEARLRQSPIVILPFAAGAKEHGPHLPMNADQVVMEYLVKHAIDSQDVIVAPPVLHGWFPAFRDFPGTEVADPDVFRGYMYLVAMSLARQGARRIVFLNTGISKATGLPIAIAAREIRVQTGVPTLVISWDDLETEAIEALAEQQEGGHGDEIETSINLYLQQDRVRMDLAPLDYGAYPKKEYPGYEPGLLSRNEKDPRYTETGIYGDATLATAEKGRQALEIMTAEWLTALEGFAQAPRRQQD